jgi:hypothetical protein
MAHRSRAGTQESAQASHRSQHTGVAQARRVGACTEDLECTRGRSQKGLVTKGVSHKARQSGILGFESTHTRVGTLESARWSRHTGVAHAQELVHTP